MKTVILPLQNINCTSIGHGEYQGTWDIETIPRIPDDVTEVSVRFNGTLYENVEISIRYDEIYTMHLGSIADVQIDYESNFGKLTTFEAGTYSVEVFYGKEKTILEGKTADNVYDRFHRLVIGDQNQIKAGSDFSTCKITSLSVKEDGASSRVSCNMTCLNHDTPFGTVAGGIQYLYDEETEEFDLILYNGYGVMFVNGTTVTVEGNAEVTQLGGTGFQWAIKYTGDFSLEIESTR